MLHLAGKSKTQYFYIRTRIELERIINLFDDSKYRYLHVSCHANQQKMSTTFDDISYLELSNILAPCLKGRRVFVSACEMASNNLAKNLFKNTGCNSLIGPRNAIRFDDAAAFWVSFYHLIFKLNEASMNRERLKRRIKELSEIFEEPINYFSREESSKNGFILVKNNHKLK